MLKGKFHFLKLTQIESINPELSFDTTIVWLGWLFVLKFCQEPLRNNPKKHDFWTIVHAESGRL